MNNKNKNNKRKNRNNRRYKFKRRNAKYTRNINVPVMSTKPIAMGYGTATLNVTANPTITDNIVNQISFQDILNNSNEFALRKFEYMYFKINYVKIIFLPLNRNGLTYTLVNWANNHDYTADQLLNSDNVKIVPDFKVKPKILTFIPPNVIVNGTSTYNPSEFRTASIGNTPGWLYIKSSTNMTGYIRIEINLVFRGSQDFEVDTIMNELNKLKFKREENKNKIEG